MENDFVHWLRGQLPPHPQLLLGPGDDAAVLELARSRECVLTVDMLTDQVDFELDRVDPRRVGHKALAVNLSDIAAMAARPLAALVSLVFPRDRPADLAVELYHGMLPLAERYAVAIAGGDTNTWNGPLAISITVIGEPTERGVLRRDGARPGDAVVVTGSFGGSILGHHLDFEPRVREALLLHEQYELHAGMDVSDGLSLDLSRLATESGCGAVIELHRVPVSAAAIELAQRAAGQAPLDRALSDGEDFELLLAMPEDEAARLVAAADLGFPVTRIGCFTHERGLFTLDEQGRKSTYTPRGYEHRLS